jgi:toxin CcdB
MRQFDVVRLRDGTLVLLLQADLLSDVNTRVVAPLIEAKRIKPVAKLQPIIRIGRTPYVALVDKMSAIMTAEIRAVVASKRDQEWDFRRALDLVFVGV